MQGFVHGDSRVEDSVVDTPLQTKTNVSAALLILWPGSGLIMHVACNAGEGGHWLDPEYFRKSHVL